MNSLHYLLPVVGGLLVLLWRFEETKRPLTRPRILIPPLGMSTGSFMFLYPPTRLPLEWALGAFLAGATLLAWPLISSTTLKVEKEQVYLKRSRAFLVVILILLIVRIALRTQIEPYLSLLQTGSLFYLLALGMIAHWRWNMWRRFQRLSQSSEA